MKQTMQSPSCCFYFLVLPILHGENTTLPLQELVTCVMCCPDRYICNKCVSNLRNNSWLQFIPYHEGFVNLLDPWPAGIREWWITVAVYARFRQTRWHTRLFSEKSRFLWDIESYYLPVSFSLVIEIIQHPFDKGFRFKVQHRYSCSMFYCPRLGKLVQEWNHRVLLHLLCGFCWLLSPVQVDPSWRYVQLCSSVSFIFAGISPLRSIMRKKTALALIRYLNCLHISCPGEAGLELENGADTQVFRPGKLPATYSTCSPNSSST